MKSFDFKHKNPTEIKTIDVSDTDQQVIKVHDANEMKPDQERPDNNIKSESPIIKPKAEPRNKRVQLLLTESNHLKLKEYAANGGTSVNDAVNQIIENL